MLYADHDTSIYIGSTKMTIEKRFYYHKHTSSSQKNNPIRDYMNTHGGYDTWKIKLIEQINYQYISGLRQREQYWINHYKKNGQTLINKKSAYVDVDPSTKIKQYHTYVNGNRYTINQKQKNIEDNRGRPKSIFRKVHEEIYDMDHGDIYLILNYIGQLKSNNIAKD